MKFYVEHLESSIGVWIEKPVENMENLIETLNNLAEEIIGEADVNSIRVTKIEGCQNPEKLFNEGGDDPKKMNEYFHDIHSLTDLEMVIFETLFNESDYHIEDILDIIFEKKYIIYEVSDLEELGEKLLEEEEENIPEWILNYINLVQYAQDQIKNNEFYELEGVGYVVLTT